MEARVWKMEENGAIEYDITSVRGVNSMLVKVWDRAINRQGTRLTRSTIAIALVFLYKYLSLTLPIYFIQRYKNPTNQKQLLRSS